MTNVWCRQGVDLPVLRTLQHDQASGRRVRAGPVRQRHTEGLDLHAQLRARPPGAFHGRQGQHAGRHRDLQVCFKFHFLFRGVSEVRHVGLRWLSTGLLWHVKNKNKDYLVAHL